MVTLRLITQITTSFIVVSAAKAFGIRITGLYVNRLQLAVITVRSKTECFRRCLLKRECVSANFWQSAEHGSSVCVLNGATRNETYAEYIQILLKDSLCVRGCDIVCVCCV